MTPHFQLTPEILAAMSRIDYSLGRLGGLSVSQPQPMLRKRNRVRAVQATAAIEGNPLSMKQVTALLDGKRVLGSANDVREMLNVNEAYERLTEWRPSTRASLLKTHAVVMHELLPGAGRFRTSGVGVFRGSALTHVAPPAHLVSHHVDQLFSWVRRRPVPTLIMGCVVHYELLFIHPFIDGNGRIARLWQQVIHQRHNALLQFVPVESIIRARQRQYYEALRRSDREGQCTPFLEFALCALADALTEFGQEVRPLRDTFKTRLEKARAHFGRKWFTRRDYLRLLINVSAPTASRDLAAGVAQHLLTFRGDGPLREYRAV